MCGIAGYIDRHNAARGQIVEAQLKLLDHRGPDSSGVFCLGRCALGQTRLAVVDLVTGDPPLTDESGKIGVALNGEIYNFRSLRQDLLKKGHTFVSSGDTEVIAHLAESNCPTALASQLNGMFSLAIWDSTSETLVLARDRFGKKPLYYWAGPRAFVFASELKALFSHPDVPKNLRADAIPDYLAFGYVPTPMTFFEGVRSLPPGSVLTVDSALQIQIERYWRPLSPPLDGTKPIEANLHDAALLLRPLIEDAVRKRLVADVPLGAFLSGGIDSSAIVALMTHESNKTVKTFTIGFEDAHGFDERPFARKVARHLGTDHTEFVVEPSSVELIEQLVWHYDQPFADSSSVPTFILSELTRKHVTVALSGDGGDELFGGYERFAASLAAERFQLLPARLKTILRAAFSQSWPGPLRSGISKLRRFAEQADRGLPDALRAWVSYTSEDDIRALTGARAETPGIVGYRDIWGTSAGCSTLDRILLLNIETYLLDDLLPKVDRMSMAHALEVRCPLLDHKLAETALRLPTRSRIRGLALKRAFKKSVTDLLPPEVLNRPKRGFGVPLEQWFRQDLRRYLSEKLGSSAARVRSHVDGSALDKMLAEHASEAANKAHSLWALLTLEVFLGQEGW